MNFSRMNSLSCIPYILQTVMWLFARPLLWIFTNLKIIGKENLIGIDDGAIVAINHMSDLDPILVPATLGPSSPLMPVFSISHERVFYKRPWPLNYLYGGIVFNLLGSYPVPIGTKKDFESLLKTHINILEGKGTVGIFPEGSKTRDGKIEEGKPGVAYLLWRTGRPVVPVAIKGHFEMFPRHFFARKHNITVCYGKPITREELFGPNVSEVQPTYDELKAVSQIIMSRIREMYERI